MDKELVKLAFQLGYGQAHVDLDKQAEAQKQAAECQTKAMTSVKEKPVSLEAIRKSVKSHIQKKAEAKAEPEAQDSAAIAKFAYQMGQEVGLRKQAFLRQNPYKRILREHGSPEDIGRMAATTIGSGVAGGVLAGEGRRGTGATVGGLLGLYLSNPKMFNALAKQLWNDGSRFVSKKLG